MKKIFLLILLPVFCLASCSSNAKQYLNKVFYYVNTEYYDENGIEKEKYFIYEFDVESKEAFNQVDDLNYTAAIQIKKDTLYSYTLSYSYGDNKMRVRTESVGVYLFDDTIVPKSINDGNGSVFYASWRNVFLDSEKMVIQTESSTSKYASYLLATKDYAKNNNIEIKKV